MTTRTPTRSMQPSLDNDLTASPVDAGEAELPDNVYTAMLGGAYDPQKMAGQLRNQNLLGMMLSSSGDRALAPLGENIANETQQELGGLARTRQALAQMGLTNSYRQAELGERAQEAELNRQNQAQMHADSMANQRLLAGIASGQPVGAGTPATPGAPPIMGDPFLQTLQPATGAMVKALAEGRMALPSGFALRSAYWQNILRDLAQYDPGFDLANPAARVQTRKQFTSGSIGQN